MYSSACIVTLEAVDMIPPLWSHHHNDAMSSALCHI
jgi:hypothetical protein